MATLMRVPEVAAGATEVVLSDWLVKESTPFTAGQPIVILETEKATVEVEAETDGILLRRLAQDNSTLEVGSVLALVGSEAERDGDIDRLLAELGVGEPAIRPAPTRRNVPDGAAADEAEPRSGDDRDGHRVFITPLARRILNEAGLTVDEIKGTGPNGRIVRSDAEKAVRAAREKASAAASAPSASPEEASADHLAKPATSQAASVPNSDFEEIPHSRLRRAIADRLTTSKQTIPHFYLRRTARMDAMLALRADLNEVSPQKISVNDLMLRAVATAHALVPDANVVWTDNVMRRYEAVDVAVAIASERGLVTPVLRDVRNATPSAIAAQVRRYARQAKEGTLGQRDLEGGSITVTNLGMYGVEEFSAIINPPHSMILAVGASSARPVVSGTAIEVANVVSLVLSVDHRAIDGALAAQWMATLVQIIEEPMRLLI